MIREYNFLRTIRMYAIFLQDPPELYIFSVYKTGETKNDLLNKA